MVRFSIQPSSRNRCTKAATRELCVEGVAAPKNPMVGNLTCCARARTDQATAAPPSSVMNSRRFRCDRRSVRPLHPAGHSCSKFSPRKLRNEPHLRADHAKTLLSPCDGRLRVIARVPFVLRNQHEDPRPDFKMGSKEPALLLDGAVHCEAATMECGLNARGRSPGCHS
jgi:hypothetical protein